MKSYVTSLIAILFVGCFGLALPCFAQCPSMDFTGDCEVNFEDFAVFALQWMDEGSYAIDEIVWVIINDPGIGDGHEGFNGEMSKYEIANGQYCEFLNAALASGDITVGTDNIVDGANGSNLGADFVNEIYFDTYAADAESQITYSGGTFSVRSRDGYDMGNHPVAEVSWYGATAFCNYYGWRLPTEWEWQAVADYDGSYGYGCGISIDYSKANYDNENPLGLSIRPSTTPVGYYSAYGYGMCDMAGNLMEWTSSFTLDGSGRRMCGGNYTGNQITCTVWNSFWYPPHYTTPYSGFRVCR